VGFSNFVIAGNFSVSLSSGTPAASISQTGLVPVGTESLLFEAHADPFQEFLSVSLGGQNLAFSAISTSANYTLYGADIAAFAGQTETLAFSASSPLSVGSVWTIDNIQFSPSSIPEPSASCLLLLGSGALMYVRRTHKKLKA
jgi:hypothetical protein